MARQKYFLYQMATFLLSIKIFLLNHFDFMIQCIIIEMQDEFLYISKIKTLSFFPIYFLLFLLRMKYILS